MSTTLVSPDATLALVQGVVILFLFMLAGVVALWIVGGCLIGFALRFLRRLPHANGRFAATLISSHINVLSGLLRVVLVVAILGFFGLQTASFAALLAGAGVAVGIACGGRRFDFAAAVFLGVLPPILNGDLLRLLISQAWGMKWRCLSPRLPPLTLFARLSPTAASLQMSLARMPIFLATV